jgi:hypothetical protein
MIQVEAAIIITGVTRLISTEILYKEINWMGKMN